MPRCRAKRRRPDVETAQRDEAPHKRPWYQMQLFYHAQQRYLYLEKEGLKERYQELTALAGRIAREVADEFGRSVQVAGCLPPLDVSYRPDLVPSDENSRPIYKNLVEVLDPCVDLFLCETMSSV